MSYNDAFFEKMVQFGMLNYDIDTIVIICEEIDEKELRQDFGIESSPVFKSYRKGKYLAKFNIDKKILELAQNGDLKAIKLLEERNA